MRESIKPAHASSGEGGSWGTRVEAVGQYLHRYFEGDPDHNQCIGRS